MTIFKGILLITYQRWNKYASRLRKGRVAARYLCYAWQRLCAQKRFGKSGAAFWQSMYGRVAYAPRCGQQKRQNKRVRFAAGVAARRHKAAARSPHLP
ncbi:hypothetical protein NPIL_606961 [Nephila pilipes]|uniref:Uncharacterized protein n=1 Tax=Nephila pilipes TaxID=299642 RepID=A0A8X6QD67_NEPPI|nr:hypothetical protein NPIL_606961 [Nephila pilipes]